MQFQLAQHQTSKPINVKAGSYVIVSPETGATALVEYTSDTVANIASGAAVWTAWSAGKVTASTTDFSAGVVHARITAEGGAVGVDIHTAAESPATAQASFDSTSGYFNGIAGPDGFLRRFGARRFTTALVCGDSITAYAEVNNTLAVGAVTLNGDGTATVDRGATAHNLFVGAPVRLASNQPATASANVMDSAVTQVIDAFKFKLQLGGRTHPVVAASGTVAPNLIYPLRRSCRGWFNWLEMLLGTSFSSTWCAVAGATSSQISALLDATPMTEAADVGFVCIGMNDVYASSLSFAAAQASIKTLIDKAQARSSLLVILTIPPKSSADTALPTWTAARQAVHAAINRWLYRYGQQIGAIVVDTWGAVQNGSTYVDPAAANPDATGGFMHDYTHPSIRGAAAIGKAVATALSPFMGVSGWKAPHKAAIGTTAGNLLTGSDFSTGTGGVATNWAIASTTTGMNVTPTLVARAVATDGDASGNNQVLTMNYGTATGTASTNFRRTGIAGLLTTGTTVQLKIPFTVTGAVGLVALDLTMIGSSASTGGWYVWGCNLDSNLTANPITGAISGWLITPPAVVPPGLTSVSISVTPYLSSAQATDMVLTLWQPELIVLS